MNGRGEGGSGRNEWWRKRLGGRRCVGRRKSRRKRKVKRVREDAKINKKVSDASVFCWMTTDYPPEGWEAIVLKSNTEIAGMETGSTSSKERIGEEGSGKKRKRPSKEPALSGSCTSTTTVHSPQVATSTLYDC
jgi:hypothetical protein